MSTDPKTPCDLIIRNAHILTMDADRTILPDGALAVTGTRIVAVGPSAGVCSEYAASRTLDARGGVVHPGLIECHMHISYLLWRWTFPDVGNWPVYLQYHRDYFDAVSEEDEYTATVLACLELARNGTTCYLEAGSVFEPEAAARATQEVGIRGILGDPHLMDLDPEGGPKVTRFKPESKRAFDLIGTQLARNDDPDALVRGHIALRGLASASDELELAGKELADKYDVPFNQHQSWDAADVRDDEARLGRHPLQHFAEIGVLGERCTWSHVNFIREDEIEPVVQSDMSICWCPTASMLLGVGATQRGMHAELYARGTNICLGSDSANSAGAYDMFEEGFLAVLTARDKRMERALGAEDALIMATVNGAKAVRLDSEIGSLEVGKRADIVIHHTGLPESYPGVDPLRTIMFSSKSKSVDTVLVNGRVVVEGGHAAELDEEKIYAQAQRQSRRLVARVGHSPNLPWPQVDKG